MTNTRRSFFRTIGAISSTAVLDPEKLLWVPKARVISIPHLLHNFSSVGHFLKAQKSGELLKIIEGAFGQYPKH